MRTIHAFVGPSGFGLEQRPELWKGISRRPPARRGDVDALVADVPEPGVAILCDGVFQIAPAVSHAELCRALDAGWAVWGVSSLGAIRAFELRDEGMHGFGYVYAQFGRFEDFTDDEMCLLHFPEPPYAPVSEALVNLRYALERADDARRISRTSIETLLAALREHWFGDRTETRIRELMLGPARVNPALAEGVLAWMRMNRVKSIDLARLLTARPWAADSRAAGESIAS